MEEKVTKGRPLLRRSQRRGRDDDRRHDQGRTAQDERGAGLGGQLEELGLPGNEPREAADAGERTREDGGRGRGAVLGEDAGSGRSSVPREDVGVREEAPRGVQAPPARAGLVYCLKVFLAVRLALAIVAVVAVSLLPDVSRLDNQDLGLPALPQAVGVPGWEAHPLTPGWHNAVTAWERFDALWYLRIATQGYEEGDGSAAFFPFYPLLIRLLSFPLGGHPLAAALVVSNVAFLGALLIFYALTRKETSEEMARRATLYAAIFPTAFFFVAPYAESLFLLLVLLSFWAARRGRFGWAGVAGALAALTRSIGLLLVLPLAVEALQQAKAERRSPLRALAWSAVPAAGTLLYLAFWYLSAGDWLAPLHQQGNWLRESAAPILTLWEGTREAFRWIGVYPGGYHMLDWLVTVTVLAAAVYLLLKVRASYSVYVWASILVPLSFVFEGRPLMSLPRFALPIFPIYWALAHWSEGHPLRHQLIVAASAGLLGIMTVLFVTWYFIF